MSMQLSIQFAASCSSPPYESCTTMNKIFINIFVNVKKDLKIIIVALLTHSSFLASYFMALTLFGSSSFMLSRFMANYFVALALLWLALL